MSRAPRYWLNALICALVLAYALYWFATGQHHGATVFSIALAVAGGVVGLVGVVWFSLRARGSAG